MALQKPESMDECVYFTSRDLEKDGKPKGGITAWVFKQDCPKCSKAKMGKPKGKDGKVKTRSTEYVCDACKNSVEKKEYEESLTANIDYECPECGNEGETQIPFIRKNINGVQTLRANCEKCNANLDITKKMKEPKKKASL